MTTPQRYTVRLIGRKEIAKDTFEIACSVPEEFTFAPGQYVWLILPGLSHPDPRGSRRAFSIASSSSQKGSISLAFRASSSGFKQTLLELPLQSEIMIYGPFGSMSISQWDNMSTILVAGGVGITPFLSMIRYATERQYPRRITLVYANGDPARVAYADVLAELQAKNPNLTVIQKIGTVDLPLLKSAAPDMKAVNWYVVGPQAMSAQVGDLLLSEGVPTDHLHFEEFYPLKKSPAVEPQSLSIGQVDVFRASVERSTSHIIITDTDGRILFANDGAQQITQFTSDELIGQTPRLWGGLMSQEFYRDLWRTIKMEHKTFRGEIQNRRKNGELYYSMTHISPIIDANNDLIGFIGTEEDITDQKHAEEKLQHKEAEDRAIMSSIGEGMIVNDVQGNIVLVNRMFEELMQFKEVEVQGRHVLDVVRQEDEMGSDVPERSEMFAKASTGVGYEVLPEQNHYFIRKDKSRFPVALKVTPVFVNGSVICTVVIFRDVTREKEIDKLRVDFLALTSHQLRTPLSGTKWLIETLQRGILGPLNEKQSEYLNNLYQTNERMIKLASDILSVVRLESTQTVVKKEEISVQKILDDIVTRMETVAKGSMIMLRAVPHTAPGRTIRTDKDITLSILESFIVNAVNYSTAGQEVVITVDEEDGGVVFSVKDFGIGIPQEEKEKIFERFYRATNAKRTKPGGTGLGLYITSVLAQKIGATVNFESEENKGSTFFVRIHTA